MCTRCNSWDNNEFWHLIEGSTQFLLSSFLSDVILGTFLPYHRWQRIKVTFPKCRIRWYTAKKNERRKKTTAAAPAKTEQEHYSLSLVGVVVDEEQQLAFIIMMEMEIEAKLHYHFIHFAIVGGSSYLETVIFNFDSNVKFMSWIVEYIKIIGFLCFSPFYTYR